MKRLLSYLGFVFLFIACSKLSEPVVELQPLPFAFSDTLLRIDSLMQRDADSALMMLTSFRPTEGSGDLSKAKAFTSGEKISSSYNDNYQSLLLSEALYKTDNAQLNRFRNETFQETSLRDAIHFFDSLYVLYPLSDDVAVLSARAHYMNGVGYYENDSVVDACKEYLRTLEIMENHFDESELVGYKAKFMGLLYTRLGSLLSNHVTARSSIDSYKNAAYYFSKIHHSGLANSYRCIGSSYLLDNNNDSALFYFRESISLAKKQNIKSAYSWALTQSAPLYYNLGYSDSAFIMINNAMALATNDDNRLTCYYVYGSLLASEHQYDSAIYYLEKSISRNRFATRTVTAELLMKCYQAIGDSVKMQYYKNQYGEQLDEYRNILTAEDDLANVYESYKQNKSQKDRLKNIRKRNFIIIVVSLFLITTIIVITVLVRKKIIMVKKKSNEDIEEKNRALAEMKRKIEANPFVTEPICKYILNVVNKNNFKAKVDFRIYKEHALNRNQIMMLRDAVNRHYDNFTQTLCKTYSELTIDDIDYCCFYLLGLKDADISALIQRAYPTVYQRSQKLKRVFNTSESLQAAVMALATRSYKNTHVADYQLPHPDT